MLKAPPRRKIRDMVADHLRTYIADQGLKPGDRLPTESALAAKFGVSRLSLREATKALEFVGLVDSKPGVGMTVGAVDFQRVSAYLGFHPGLANVPAEQLIETRIVVETGVLPYVMRRMRDDRTILAALTAINDRLRGARDLSEWVELDIAFHRQLVESSGISPLLAFNDLLAAFFQRFRESVSKAQWKRGVESHQHLLDALAAGQLEAAERELLSHIQSHKKRMGLS